MKTHFAEENDDVISAKQTAEEHCWQQHRISRPQLIGDMVIVVVLLFGLLISGSLFSPAPVAPGDNRANAQVPLPAFASHAMRQRSVDSDDDR